MSADDSQHRKSPVPAFDGRFIVGKRGMIEDVDAAGCALLGYARDEVVGMHGSELVPFTARPATATSLDRMRLGEIARCEGRLTHKDGTVLDVDVTAQALPDGRLTLSLRKLLIS
jgi:PAS domain S-box-containing protein